MTPQEVSQRLLDSGVRVIYVVESLPKRWLGGGLATNCCVRASPSVPIMRRRRAPSRATTLRTNFRSL
jgi:hypothetical protein